MFTLSRYLASMVFWATAAGVLVFVFILILGNAMRDALILLAEGFIPVSLFLQLLWMLVPYAVAFALPLGVLIAILLVMGRLSANHEITALKAAGIPLSTVTAPILMVAMAGTLLSVYIHAFHAPQARSNYKDIINDVVRYDPLRFIVPRTFIHDFPGYVLYVGEIHQSQMRQFWLWELDPQRRAVRLLRAESGELRFDDATDSLTLVLRNGFTELRDPNDPDNLREIRPTLAFSDAQIRLPLANLLGAAHRPPSLGNTPLDGLLLKRQQAQRVAADPDADPQLRDRAQIESSQALFHISQRFAMAFSVFSLAVFAIPLGIRVGRTETYANFAIAIIIAMTYYLALTLIGWTERNPQLRPELLIWLPNFVAQGIGFYLLHRAQMR